METRHSSDAVLLRRLLTHTRPCWGALLALLALGACSLPLSLLAPVPLKIAVDHVIGNQPLPIWLDTAIPGVVPRTPRALLVVTALMVLLVALLNQVRNLLATVISTSAGQRLIREFRTTLFRHVQRLSLTYHDEKGSADASYRIAWDAQAIQYIAVDSVVTFVSAFLSFVGMVYVTARLDWQLAVIALAISPVLFGLSHIYRDRLRARYRDLKRVESGAMAVVQEVLSALRVVKAFGQEEREERRFSEQAEEGVQAQRRISWTEGGFALLIGMVTASGTAVALLIGVSHVRAGTLTLGELLLLTAYLAQLYDPLTTMSRRVANIQTHFASIDRALALLDQSPDVPERPGARAVRRAVGAVSFKNVAFGYAADRSTLSDISFDLPAGSRLGITGTTGAGKTTLVNLLSRFYDPTAGQILLDGVDLRDYRVADLRRQFAIVLQEPVLFSTTLRENIAYGRPSATDAEIIEAARAANIHDFIAQLPQGYDTPVGERGMRLSGGERQRISLARAFLKDAPILILDEPTSSVDLVTEGLIMEAMERLMRGRTTVMIAHRLSTLEFCDMRISLEQGRITAAASVPLERAHAAAAPLPLAPHTQIH